jgi:hypothetical protein
MPRTYGRGTLAGSIQSASIINSLAINDPLIQITKFIIRLLDNFYIIINKKIISLKIQLKMKELLKL